MAASYTKQSLSISQKKALLLTFFISLVFLQSNAVGFYMDGGTLYVDGDFVVDGDASNGDLQITATATLNLGTATANMRAKGFTMDGTFSGHTSSTLTATGGTFTGSSALTVPGNLTIGGAVSLGQDVTVTTTLATGANKLTLNGKKVTITTSSTGAITSSSGGGLVSENTSLNSKLAWNMGTTAGTFVVPFVTSGGTDIPVTVVTDGTNVGYVTMATYSSNAANNPKPTGITHVSGVPDEAVDRYWYIAKSAGAGTPDVTFTYAAAETPANGETNMRMQSANTGTNTWEAAPAGQSASTASNTVTLPSFNKFAQPLTLSQNGALGSSPLPIELTYFVASCSDGQVTINWETASEINNYGFQIERSLDAFSNYSLLNEQLIPESEANSSVSKSYFYNDLLPFSGTAYYRLKQIDNNGVYEYFGPIAVSCNSLGRFGMLSTIINNEVQSLTVTFTAEENETIHYSLIDYKGQEITQDNLITQNGTNQLILNTAGLVKGLYLLSIANKQNKYTDKIVIR